MTLNLFNPDRFSVDRFRAQVWKDLDVEPLPAFSRRTEPSSRKRKREKVNSTIDRFVDLMASDDAPQTEAEMIAALTPVLTWVLSWFIRQLVIEVLRACWRRWST